MTGETKFAVLVAHDQFFMESGVRIVTGPAPYLPVKKTYSAVNYRTRFQIRFGPSIDPYGLVIHADGVAVAVVPEEALLMAP
jgi:hypothetical protein